MINKDRNTMKWTAGIYARVSTDKDNQKLSNEHQISSMEEWATGQKNVEIYDTYIDEGISGTKIDKRYSFQRMIKDAKNGVINFIIVKSVTRFARNQIDSIKLASELKEKGVRIFFYQEGIDTFEDSKMLGLWAWLAENESRVTSERRSLGGREAQKKGRFTNNRPPFGYRTVNGKLVINEEESPIVTRIFNLYAEGNGFAKIASILNEEGMKTRRGFNFRSDKIKYMLLNESYKGTFTGNRYTKADMLSKQVIEKPKEDWIIIEDNHDSIINKELFDTVHALMNEKSFTLGKRSKSYFAGVVKCAKCGCGYNRSITKKKTKGGYKEHIYYRCSGRTQKGESTCNSKPIKEELLLEVVQNEMNLLKRNPDIIENIKKQTLAQITDKINNIDSDIINIENRVTEIESDRKMLAKKNIKGVIDDDIFMEMDAELKAELKSLNQRKNKTRIVDSAKIFEKRYDDFVNTLLHFDDIRNLNNIEVRRLLEVVEINDDEISIEIKINAVDFGIEESLNIAPIISTIGSSTSHERVLENPDLISQTVLAKGLDSGTAFEILSIDIADVDIGKNIGAELQTEQAEADKKIAQAKAEERRAMAVASEQEMKAKVVEMRSKVVEAEAEVPLAMAEALREGNIGVMDYMNYKNIQADTSMRDSISKVGGDKPSTEELKD